MQFHKRLIHFQGVRLEESYVAPKCSPSRWAADHIYEALRLKITNFIHMYTDQGSPHDRGLPVATRKTTWSYWKIPGKFFLPCNVPMCIFRQLGWTQASHSSQSSWSRVDTRPTWWANGDFSVVKGREGFTTACNVDKNQIKTTTCCYHQLHNFIRAFMTGREMAPWLL